MKKIRVGVVGAGYLGKFHAEKYAHMDDVELVGVVDKDPGKAQSVAQEFDTLAFTNHNDLVRKVDAVSVATQTPYHFDISKDFLENDVDVLIEKPITTTLEEANTLIGIADARGRIIQVGHLERFNPAVIALEGVINQPMFIESHRLSVYQERGTDVDVVLDLMIHDIDIILSFVKSEVTKINAVGVSVVSPKIDIANARLKFANNCVANVTASRISMKAMRKIRIFQKDAYVSVDYANRDTTVVKRDDNNLSGLIPGMDIRRTNFKQADPLDAELRSFIRCVSKREVPAVSGRDGRNALKVALSVIDQIKKAKWEKEKDNR
jgi:predicted dehydrogenase